MKIVWDRDAGKASVDGGEFDITSEVRNEVNGRRKLHRPAEVVYSMTEECYKGPPYMPRPFPKGTWPVYAVEKTDKPEFAPVKIKTAAHQKVEVWALDEKGGYERPTGETVDDWGYWLHWSEWSRTTLGCGRVGGGSAKQVVALAELIQAAWGRGEDVVLEVV